MSDRIIYQLFDFHWNINENIYLTLFFYEIHLLLRQPLNRVPSVSRL